MRLILVLLFVVGWTLSTIQRALAADCGTFDLGCQVGNLASGLFDMLAKAFIEGVASVVVGIATFWMAVPTPDLASGPDGTPSDPVAFLQSSLGFYTGLLATLGVSISIARIAWAHHTHSRTRELQTVTKQVVTLIAVQGGGLAALWVGVKAGDAFAPWLLQRSTGSPDFATNLTAVLGLTVATGIGAVILALLAFFDVIFGVGQLLGMIARGGALVVAAGVWPTAASFRSSEAGEQWYRKITAWIIALIVYKPTAAIIYAAGFRLVGQKAFGDNGLVNVLTGMLMLLLATFALPALMRFAVPLVAVARLGGGGGGGGGGGAAAVAGGASVVAGYVSSSGGGNTPGGAVSGGPSGSIPPGGPGGAGSAGPAGASGAAGAAGAGAAAGGPVGAGIAAGSQVIQGAVNGARNTAGRATGDNS